MLFKRIILSIIALVAFSIAFAGCRGQEEAAPMATGAQATETVTQESTDNSSSSTQTPVSQVNPDELESVLIDSDYVKSPMAVSGIEPVNLVENPSVEDVYANVSPYRWYYKSWGNNNSKFTYLKEGHTGERSMLIEVSDYVNGDARWNFRHLWLDAGFYYTSHYYRSDVDTQVVVRLIMNDYSRVYVELKTAPANEEWTKYETFFTMPEDARSATIYHMIRDNGYLNTDDFVVSAYEFVGFSKAMVTISFDDGWQYNKDTVIPVMNEYGFKSNQFYATNLIRNAEVEDPREYIIPFIEAGHEIGSHTITHSDMVTLTDEELRIELEESKRFLQNYLGIEIKHFASPYGAYDEDVNEEIMKYYYSHRTVDVGYNSLDNIDASRLMCMSVVLTTTTEEVRRWVQKAEEENLWLILLFHDVYDEAGQFGTTPQSFAKFMQIISEADVEVVTISEALEVIEADLN